MNLLDLAGMMNDKHFFDLKKMGYKYSKSDVLEMVDTLREISYEPLPLLDFSGNACVYQKVHGQANSAMMRKLLAAQNTKEKFGKKAMEAEIDATLKIENIESNRDSVRKILAGFAPENREEAQIYAMKKGLDFISDAQNKITQENLHKLYSLSISEFLESNDKLLEGNFYRHDAVYIVGDKPYHEGIKSALLPKYMGELISFANEKDGINELVKASMLHFYFAYLHPYFDGNGRTARLFHLWYLVQQGFSGTLFHAFSEHIMSSKNKYYNSFMLIESNFEISKVLDLTPFIVYFSENVYAKIENSEDNLATIELYKNLVSDGKITEKERDLWSFVLSSYGTSEFSTKMLEHDFGKVAYATVRTFVLKFEKFGLLSSQKYGNRVKYKVSA